MPRSSTRQRRSPTRFGYDASGEPYPQGAQLKSMRSIRQPGRREVPEEPLVIEKPPKKDNQLKVLQLDCLMKKNMKAHHTDEYETEEMVLRRGQSFDMEVTLHRNFVKGSDKISLEFLMGGRPIVSHGTRVPVNEPPADNFDWGLKITSVKGSKVCLTVYSSADSLIGPYKLVVNTFTGSGVEFEFEHPTDIFMIFNPWCKADGVYMADAAKREEYVMNETNLVYQGSLNYPTPWYQGQFEDVAIQCAFYLLKKSGMTYRYRRDPVMVARFMSKMVNHYDDDGVLFGKWGDDGYEDGVVPGLWTGSIAILKKYMETLKPVKYGQCWVFGSVLTTIMRALGVPTRTVTNFGSFHDTDNNLTWDVHVDENFKPLENLEEEKIWNFHVWNDCWMARPDLPKAGGYGGWQAVDATPQETSGGVFQMGPASLTAIKQGDVHMDYDTKFAFAEVNAEKVTWLVPKDSRKPQEVLWVESDVVGFNISTKAVGKNYRHDVTEDYKYPEGSHLERIAVYNASKHVKKAKNFIKDIKEDVKFKADFEDAMIGSDFKVKVTMTNSSKKSRKLFLAVYGNTVYYTGIKKAEVGEFKKDVTLAAGETYSISINCDADDYLPKLTEFGGFNFFVMARVSETKQVFSKHYDTVLDKPDITITADEDIHAGTSFYATMSFTNPLPYALNNCRFLVEGPGIEGYKEEKFRKVNKGEEVEHKIKLMPKRPGTRTLMVSFKSNELTGVKGSEDLVVLA